MTTLLSVDNLQVSFLQSGHERPAVKGVSFELDHGKTLALVGESGSGKSVTALSLVQLLGKNAKVSGSVIFQGQDLIAMDETALQNVRGAKVSFVFQEPMTSLNPLHTIEQQLHESLKKHQSLSGKTLQEKTLELLGDVGLHDAESRLASYPHQLSGGQRQRVMIAMALANEPELLIADEPTTALDVTIQAQILELLLELKTKRNMSLLFITHDLGIVERIADDVCVMSDGHIVEQGRSADVFSQPQHEYTKRLLSAEPSGAPTPIHQNSQTIVSAEDIKVWFPIRKGLFSRHVGEVKALNPLDIEIKEGETLGIVGESGSGKTTLALAIARLQAAQGHVSVLGRPVFDLPKAHMRDLRRDMQIVFQDPYGALSPRMSVESIISEGLLVHHRLSRHEARARVAKMMKEVGLEPEKMSSYPHEFSGGQRQRISIARAMILKPKFVILDEPTSALDMTVQAQIVDLLRYFQDTYGMAYLFISHDLKVVRALSHRVIVMKQGDVVETGPSEQVFNAPSSPYTQQLMAAAFLNKAI